MSILGQQVKTTREVSKRSRSDPLYSDPLYMIRRREKNASERCLAYLEREEEFQVFAGQFFSDGLVATDDQLS